MTASPTRIAIIGAGASGVMTALQLVHQRTTGNAETRHNLAVHLLDRQPRPGAGVAYSSGLDCHILNMRTRSMSLYEHDPGHFTRWLREQPEAAQITGHLEEHYPPRHIYGRYLRHCLGEAVREAAQHHITVDFQQCDVTDVVSEGDSLRLTADQPLPRFDHAVLCLGDLPATAYRQFATHPRYAPTPWDPGFYPSIGPADAVGVLGTSLTAVDTLLALQAAGHSGPVYAFARTRGLPKVQPRTLRPHSLKHLTPEHLNHLTRHGPLDLADTAALFRRELDDALGDDGWPSPAQNPRSDAAADLAHDIRQAEGDGAHWYEVLDATSPLAPDIWQRMSYRAKAEFLHHYSSLWATYRHPMPLVNAHLVAQHLSSGQLRVLTGITGVTAASDGTFDIRRTAPGGDVTHRVDRLINTTGTATDPWLIDSPLLTTLLHRGILTTHPLGGIDVHPHTLRTRDRNGDLHPRIHFLGPLTNGVHFYTNSIETNLTNATHLANSLTSGSP
ncbi:FAD/NAD(P)-binding protein [Streptomyces beijiangensis]|uniref:FAD-dependent oxidoreductase n=1 Tax=Streptomyces beijiangensis TaxID=163361 RepID=A0A939F4U1_9ACTN|nr:FAD/NAD(P)-binding protein [Streptomyces beijiangensis]MBO0511916.1 FAD-dependent oxidoreductase [Streptomyces beijiangensis]